MTERLRNLLGAFAGLFILYLLLAPGMRPAPSSVPISDDWGPSGYAALRQWLQASGYRVTSHQVRFGELPRYGDGTLLIMTWPFDKEVQHDEWHSLLTWLQDGNRLVLLGSPLPVAEWQLRRPSPINVLLEPLGVEPAGSCESDCEEPTPDDARIDETDTPLEEAAALLEDLGQDVRFEPAFRHPLFDGVDALQLADAWAVDPDYFSGRVAAAVPLLTDSRGRAAGWFLRTSAIPGGFVLLTHPDFLNNQGLFDPARQQFASNIFRLYADPDSGVIFDDFHQGQSALYDTRAFFLDPRTWWSFSAIFCLWIAYVVFYAARLGPVEASRVQVSNAAFARRTGFLFARHTPADQLHERLLSRFNNHYRQRYHLPVNGESVVAHARNNYHFSTREISLLEQLERNPAADPVRTQSSLAQLYRVIHSRVIKDPSHERYERTAVS